MVITLYGPFEKLAEKQVRIELQEPVSAHEVIRILASRYPDFARYADKRDDAEPPAHGGGTHQPAAAHGTGLERLLRVSKVDRGIG
jgi:hypothetical protein